MDTYQKLANCILDPDLLYPFNFRQLLEIYRIPNYFAYNLFHLGKKEELKRGVLGDRETTLEGLCPQLIMYYGHFDIIAELLARTDIKILNRDLVKDVAKTIMLNKKYFPVSPVAVEIYLQYCGKLPLSVIDHYIGTKNYDTLIYVFNTPDNHSDIFNIKALQMVIKYYSTLSKSFGHLVSREL